MVKELINIKNVFKEYVLSGQPFELIDEDNNISLVDFYKDLLKDLSELETYYVSILGP